MRVKICGITRLQDAELALKLGATDLGFIFAPSPRRMSPEMARDLRRGLELTAFCTGVFVNEAPEKIIDLAQSLDLRGVQLHGQESAEEVTYLKRKLPEVMVIKSIGVRGGEFLLEATDYLSCDYLLYDCAGSHFDPVSRRAIRTGIRSPKSFFLAGGLNPGNVLELINLHRPAGIDLSSGVESSPGIKDGALLKELFSRLKDLPCKPQ